MVVLVSLSAGGDAWCLCLPGAYTRPHPQRGMRDGAQCGGCSRVERCLSGFRGW